MLLEECETVGAGGGQRRELFQVRDGLLRDRDRARPDYFRRLDRQEQEERPHRLLVEEDRLNRLCAAAGMPRRLEQVGPLERLHHLEETLRQRPLGPRCERSRGGPLHELRDHGHLALLDFLGERERDGRAERAGEGLPRQGDRRDQEQAGEESSGSSHDRRFYHDPGRAIEVIPAPGASGRRRCGRPRPPEGCRRGSRGRR